MQIYKDHKLIFKSVIDCIPHSYVQFGGNVFTPYGYLFKHKWCNNTTDGSDDEYKPADNPFTVKKLTICMLLEKKNLLNVHF